LTGSRSASGCIVGVAVVTDLGEEVAALSRMAGITHQNVGALVLATSLT